MFPAVQYVSIKLECLFKQMLLPIRIPVEEAVQLFQSVSVFAEQAIKCMPDICNRQCLPYKCHLLSTVSSATPCLKSQAMVNLIL